MKRRIFITILFLISLNAFAKAQDSSLYEKHFFVSGNDTLLYRVLLPLGYDEKKKYPLLLFLHSAGERGSDNEAQLVHGGDIFVRDSNTKKYRTVVILPPSPVASYWSDVHKTTDTPTGQRTCSFNTDEQPTFAMRWLLVFIIDLHNRYSLDESQLYVGGLSMGGMGTYELVRRMPCKFAVAFAICGAADTDTAKQINKPAWWIFHGLKDDVVDRQFSKNMDLALKNAGADVKITLYPQDGHDSRDDAFKGPPLFSWLFSNYTLKKVA